MKKRALSESEFWESGMNPSLYSVCDSEGTFTGVIDSKKWGKKSLLQKIMLNKLPRSRTRYQDYDLKGERYCLKTMTMKLLMS